MLFHVLYGNDDRFTLELCRQSAQRIAAAIGDESPLRLAEIGGRSPHAARCVFVLLLNVDMALKELVCSGVEGRLQGFCGHRAPVFFRELKASVVPAFLRDERKMTVDLEAMAQELYQCS